MFPGLTFGSIQQCISIMKEKSLSVWCAFLASQFVPSKHDRSTVF